MLIDSSPQAELLTFNFDDNLIEMPLITRLWPLLTNLIGVALRRFETSPFDRFVGDRDTSIEHHFLDVTKAQREGVIQTHTVADDLGGEAVAMVRISHGYSVSKSVTQRQISAT